MTRERKESMQWRRTWLVAVDNEKWMTDGNRGIQLQKGVEVGGWIPNYTWSIDVAQDKSVCLDNLI